MQSSETLRATCSQVIDRLRCMIRAKGGYFKQMLINLKVYLCTFILSPYFKPGVGNLRPAGQIRPAKQNHPARDMLVRY